LEFHCIVVHSKSLTVFCLHMGPFTNGQCQASLCCVECQQIPDTIFWNPPNTWDLIHNNSMWLMVSWIESLKPVLIDRSCVSGWFMNEKVLQKAFRAAFLRLIIDSEIQNISPSSIWNNQSPSLQLIYHIRSSFCGRTVFWGVCLSWHATSGCRIFMTLSGELDRPGFAKMPAKLASRNHLRTAGSKTETMMTWFFSVGTDTKFCYDLSRSKFASSLSFFMIFEKHFIICILDVMHFFIINRSWKMFLISQLR
jgi:hypothetical protein